METVNTMAQTLQATQDKQQKGKTPMRKKKAYQEAVTQTNTENDKGGQTMSLKEKIDHLQDTLHGYGYELAIIYEMVEMSNLALDLASGGTDKGISMHYLNQYVDLAHGYNQTISRKLDEIAASLMEYDLNELKEV